MIKTIMVGSVSITRPTEVFAARPMHVPTFDELVALAYRYEAYTKYGENVGSTQTAMDAMAKAVKIERYLDKMYKRWWMGLDNETVK